MCVVYYVSLIFCKQKTAYDMRIRDGNSSVGSSALRGELRGAEALAHGSHSGLRVNEVVGHDCRNVDARHALLDRTLHTKQANAILIFQQFADRTHAAVAEIVDMIDFALTIFKVHQFLDDRDNVFTAQRGEIGRANV